LAFQTNHVPLPGTHDPDYGQIDMGRNKQTELTDYAELVRPHVAAVHAVLHGERFRYKLRHADATFLFDHGCLMGRIYFQGRFYAFPPLAVDRLGRPYLHELPAVQREALKDFCALPKGLLLFYFTLLKTVCGATPLRCLSRKNNSRFSLWVPMPEPLRPWLQTVGWPYASAEAVGCKAS